MKYSRELKASLFSEKIEKLLGSRLTESDKVLIRRYVLEAYELGHADGYAQCIYDNYGA
jgi:hypothetical protein